MDLLSDIDNAVRTDQMKALWQKYGSALATALLAMLVAVAIYQGYQGWQNSKNTKATDALIAALQTGEVKDLNEFATQASGSHKMIASLVAANKEKDMAKRAVLLDEIASDSSVPRDFRDLATIMKLRVVTPTNKEDAQKQADTLEKIASDKRAAFSVLARLDLSTLQARSLNDLKAARETLKPVFEQTDIPSDLLQQARALDQVYKIDMEKK